MKTEQRISNYAAAPAKRGAKAQLALAKQGANCKASAKGARQTQGKAYARLSASELRTLVAAAQRFDEEAIAKLCATFKPLILKEAYAAHIVAKLGDDAVNTAWEIFLEFLQAYSKRSYRIFPTLAQTNLRYGLLRKVSRLKSVQDLAVLDETDAQGNRIFNPSDRNGLMEALHEKKFAEDLLAELSEKQRQVIVETVIEGYTLEEFSQAKDISPTAAYRLRKRGLALLRAKFKQTAHK